MVKSDVAIDTLLCIAAIKAFRTVGGMYRFDDPLSSTYVADVAPSHAKSYRVDPITIAVTLILKYD